MRFIYKPFGFLVGILAGLLGRRIFNALWEQFDDEDPPKPTEPEVPVGKIVAAAAVQGLVQRGTKAAVDHYGARGFYHLTGTWPGKRQAE